MNILFRSGRPSRLSSRRNSSLSDDSVLPEEPQHLEADDSFLPARCQRPPHNLYKTNPSSDSSKVVDTQNKNQSTSQKDKSRVSIFSSIVRRPTLDSFQQKSHVSKESKRSERRSELRTGKSTLQSNNSRAAQQESIVALTENKGRQIGAAVFNTKTGEIYVSQFNQTPQYIKIVSFVQKAQPLQLIVPHTLRTPLLQKISYKSVPRSYFDQTKGFNFYRERSNKRQQLLNADSKYVAWAALSALVIFLQEESRFEFSKQNLCVKYRSMQNVMIVERRCILDLQLFLNKKTNKPQNSFFEKFKCVTNGGKRLLRGQLMQPLLDSHLIDFRLGLVKKWVRDRRECDRVRKQLQKFKQVDVITYRLSQRVREFDSRIFETYVNQLLLLKSMLRSLADFPQIQGLEIPKEKLTPLRNQLQTVLVEGSFKAKDKNKNLFIVQSNNQCLQLARMVFGRAINEIGEYFQTQKDKLPGLSLLQNRVSFSLKCPNLLEKSQLERIFGEEVSSYQCKGKHVTFKLLALQSLNLKLIESSKEIMVQSYDQLVRLVQLAQTHSDSLFQLSQRLATIDMLSAFTVFSIEQRLQAPSFSQDSIESRQILLSSQHCTQLMKSQQQNLNKLQRIGLSVILSQIGCFALLKPFKSCMVNLLISRLNIKDSLEFGLSKFQAQMVVLNSITQTLNSLKGRVLFLFNDLITTTQRQQCQAFTLAALQLFRQRQCLSLGVLTQMSLIQGSHEAEQEQQAALISELRRYRLQQKLLPALQDCLNKLNNFL